MPSAAHPPGSGPGTAGQGCHAGCPGGGTGACWCQAGSGCRRHRPRRSRGPGPGSTPHRHCRTSHTGAAAAGPRPALSPRTAFAGRDTGRTRDERVLHTEAARLSAPWALLRPLTFARVFQNFLSAFPEQKMFITHLICIGSYARAWRRWGTSGVFSLRGFSRPSQQQTFALYPNGLASDFRGELCLEQS